MTPMDRSKYPPNWDEIARAYKDSVFWTCENPACGIEHMADGTMGSCLTVHHPDHDPHDPCARLIALCARCHLKEEVRYRQEALWAEKYAGQLDLFVKEVGDD